MDDIEKTNDISNKSGSSDTAVLVQPQTTDKKNDASPQNKNSGNMNEKSNSASLGNEINAKDLKFLAALDNILEKHSNRTRTHAAKERSAVKQIAETLSKSGVGVISLGIILIFIGVMLSYCLFSPKHDFLLLLKLSPVCLAVIGLDISINQFVLRARFKLHIPSILISTAVTIFACVICAVFNVQSNKSSNEYNNRSIAAEIYDLSYESLKNKADIEKLDVKVDINPIGNKQINGVSSLSTDDYVDITISLSGVIESPKEFAAICKSIIECYNKMDISITNFYFSNESSLHSYNLEVEGRFAQNLSSEELENKVNHIYFRDMDYIRDLEDPVDNSDDAGY